MQFSVFALATIFAAGIMASPLRARDNDNNDNDHDNEGGLKRICPNLRTMDGGCIRYTRGFDVTGVVTEVDLTFPTVQNECDCIQQCLDRPTTCATYVYKFSTPASVQSGHRTCTLYSQFNLPNDVTIDYNLDSNLNANINGAEILANGNNPQKGGPVPQAFKDINLNTTPDKDAVSGPVWQLANGQVQC